MKTLFLATTMLMFCFLLQGQDVKSDSTKYTYCELVGTGKFLSNKVTVEIDFGQVQKKISDNRYKDPATGKPIVFNSMVDALNFMGKDRWEFVQAYTIGDANSGYVYHFLLKKETTLVEKEK